MFNYLTPNHREGGVLRVIVLHAILHAASSELAVLQCCELACIHVACVFSCLLVLNRLREKLLIQVRAANAHEHAHTQIRSESRHVHPYGRSRSVTQIARCRKESDGQRERAEGWAGRRDGRIHVHVTSGPVVTHEPTMVAPTMTAT